MKTKQLISFAALSLLCACGGNDTNYNTIKKEKIDDGQWVGYLETPLMKLPLVLGIQHNQAGEASCYLMSPKQTKDTIPAALDFISEDSVAVTSSMIGLTYRGKLTDGKIVGEFSQNGLTMAMDMEYCADGLAQDNRPQTPKPPFPYTTEEVEFSNPDATLSGTLTLPEKMDGKVPVVLMVSGSGLQNRDEEIMGHKPFAVIADYLAKNGIASLRYDDRGCGKSVGDGQNATTFDFANDAQSGMEFLRKDPRFSRVGILGHSEGGAIAYILGAKGLPDFIVSLAGPTVKGDELLAEQVNTINKLAGSSEVITASVYRERAYGKNGAWMDAFIDYDPAENIKNTKCPVFSLHGLKDCQVIPEQNTKALRNSMPGAGSIIKEYPGLNHLFQHCTTGLPTEYGDIEETISDEVLKDIASWIVKIR